MKTVLAREIRRCGLIVPAVVATAAIAACGSSSNSGGSSGSGASATPSSASSSSGSSTTKFTGAPVQIGIIADVGTSLDWSDVVAADRAGVRQVNSTGGIDGHQVVLDFCNEAFNPNTAEACARQMVANHVMAMADDGVATAEGDVDAIMKKAGIPQIGTDAFSGVSATDSNTYMTDGFELYNIAALAKYAISLGEKRVSIATVDIPATAVYAQVAEGVTKTLGGTYTGDVGIPETFSDLSTEAAALIAQKPDVVLLECSPNGGLALIKSMTELGYTGKFANNGNFFTQSEIEGLGSTANQLIFASPYPPVTDTSIPGIKSFLSAVQAEKASGDNSAQPGPKIVATQDVGGWLSVTAIAKIANAAKATTSVTFKKAIDAATDVNLDGVIPAWTPNATGTNATFPRVNNPTYYEYTWTSNGVKMASTPQPANVGQLFNENFKG